MRTFVEKIGKQQVLTHDGFGPGDKANCAPGGKALSQDQFKVIKNHGQDKPANFHKIYKLPQSSKMRGCEGYQCVRVIRDMNGNVVCVAHSKKKDQVGI